MQLEVLTIVEMYSELDRLLTEAEELNMDASDNNYNDLPRVERNLSQVFLESQEMRSRLHQPSDNNAVQAYVDNPFSFTQKSQNLT